MFYRIRPPLLVAVVSAIVSLSACSSSDSPSDRADITPEALATLQADLADLRAQVVTLMGRADITPADLQALQDQVATLTGRADITPADLQALQDQVATLMGRADITPADLQALQDQVATLMQRADITPVDLQALQDQLAAVEQALVPLQQALDPRILEDDWRHDRAEYIRTVAGGQEPTLPSALQDAKVRQITADSDTVATLYFWSAADSEFNQVDPDCSGTTCTFGNPEDPPLTKETIVEPPEDITIYPVMRHNGAEVHISQSAGYDSIGPWNAVAYAAVFDHLIAVTNYQWWEGGQEGSGRFIWGDSTGHNPAAGAASWSGVLVAVGGRPGAGEAFQWIQGDVDITAHFGNETTVDVMFSNVKGAEYDADYTIDPWIGIPVSGGTFESGDYFFDGEVGSGRYLEGRFYGPNAEEAGGLINDWNSSTPGTDINGAFGAARNGE